MSSCRKSPPFYTSSEYEILQQVKPENERLLKPQEVLKNHEEELVSALQGVNIVDLSSKLLGAVLKEHLKNKVSSLDIDGLDCRVCVRYLIRLVYESIQNND